MNNDAGMNPSVAQALEGIAGASPELSSVLGSPPPILGVPLPPQGPGRPKGGFQVASAAAGAEAKAAAEQDKQALTEAQAAKGLVGHAAKKFPWLTGKVPGAQRVRVRQRNGAQLVTIGDYSKSDVESSPDIESFVSTYLRPQYGGGEYQIFLIDEIGKEMDGGIVRFPEPAKNPFTALPPAPDPTAGMMPLMVEMYRNSTKTMPAPDPIKQLRDARDLLMENAPKNDNSVLAMMMQMQQQSMQMQMQMQQAQQQAQAAAQQQMMALFAQKPASDPAVLAILERLERAASAPPPPPPMMPPPPPAPTHTLPELISAITGAVAAVVPLMKGDPGPKSTEIAQLILQAQTAARPTDGLGVKDVIEIFQRREQDASPPATLEEQLGTLARVKEFISQVNPPQQQAPTGTTFWDAAIAILGNGSEISKAIGARVDKSLEPRQEERQQVQITHNRQVQPTVQPAGEMGPQASPQEEPLRLPQNFPEKMAALEAATTPGERIQTTVDALLSLRGIDQWNGFSSKLLVAVAENDRHSSLKLLGGWLKMLMDANLLKRPAAEETLKAFAESFAIVRAGMLEMVPDPRLKVLAQAADARAAAQAQQVAPPAQGPVPPAAAAPAPEESSDEEDAEEDSGEKATGPAPTLVDLGHDAEVAAYTG